MHTSEQTGKNGLHCKYVYCNKTKKCSYYDYCFIVSLREDKSGQGKFKSLIGLSSVTFPLTLVFKSNQKKSKFKLSC